MNDMSTRIKAAMKERHFSLGKVVELTGLGKSTIQRGFNGTRPWSDESLAIIGKVLGIELLGASVTAAKELGGYNRSTVESTLAGSYLTIRLHPSGDNSFRVYKTEFKWCDQSRCAIFIETERDYSPTNVRNNINTVSILPASNMFYFATQNREDGRQRLINVSRNAGTRTMNGLVLTNKSHPGTQVLIPTIAAIAYIPDDGSIPCGVVCLGDAAYERCAQIVSAIEQCVHIEGFMDRRKSNGIVANGVDAAARPVPIGDRVPDTRRSVVIVDDEKNIVTSLGMSFEAAVFRSVLF
jgi:transcriptional regulator with XRE-family HTH domain